MVCVFLSVSNAFVCMVSFMLQFLFMRCHICCKHKPHFDIKSFDIKSCQHAMEKILTWTKIYRAVSYLKIAADLRSLD